MTRAAIAGCFLASACATALSGCAQYYPNGVPTQTGILNQDVQRLWNDTFDPNRDGNQAAWERQREVERRNWCGYHPDYARCGAYR